MYVLTEITLEDFGEEVVDDDSNTNKFHAICSCSDIKDRSSASIFKSIQKLKSKADRRDAHKGIRHLLKLLQQGKPLNDITDDEKVHPACAPYKCSVTGKKTKIWRYRYRDIRILFCYYEDKLLLMFDVIVKREDKFTQSEVRKIHKKVNTFLNIVTSDKVNIQWI